MTEFEKRCIDVLNAYEGDRPLISCQGQGMDGYSALHNFVELTKALRESQTQAQDGKYG